MAWEVWQCYWDAASVGDAEGMAAALAQLTEIEHAIAYDPSPNPR